MPTTPLTDPALASPAVAADRTAAIARLLDPAEIVLFDGAMGTSCTRAGVFINQCYDELALRAPDLVRDVHRAYVQAGAEVLETNSFGANRQARARTGSRRRSTAINRRAAELAREAADRARDPEGVGSTRARRRRRRARSACASSRTARRRATRRGRCFASRWPPSSAGGATSSCSRRSATCTSWSRRSAPRARSTPRCRSSRRSTIGVDLHTPYGATPEDVGARARRAGAPTSSASTARSVRRRSSRRSSRWLPSRRAS